MIMRPGGVQGSAPVEVRELAAGDTPAAVGVIARGMQDNPVNVAVYGADPRRRRRAYGRLIRTLLSVSPSAQLLGAFRDDALLAVAVSAPPGTCQPGLAARARLVATVVGFGPGTAARTVAWASRWSGRDLVESHVHLGPGAVDEGLRGQGLGSALLEEHCRRLDAARAVGYLETDRPGAVRLYARFGFEVVGRVEVVGVPSWLMRRPRCAASAAVRRSQIDGR